MLNLPLRVELGASAQQIRDHLAARGHLATSEPQFANTEPGAGGNLPARSVPGVLTEMVRGRATRRPDLPIPVVPYASGSRSADTSTAVTWLGHASVLLELAGRRFLFDPVVGERVSPSRLVGPRRLHPTPARLADLAPDAVVISHDHYDHLERRTILALATTTRTRFVVPLGVGAHLRHWGVDANRIDELGWEDAVDLGPVRLTCTEARHFSGRTLRRDTTLWASWALRAGDTRVYFGGDTGYTAAFGRIGAEHGPFDLTILPIGAYDPSWRDIHLNPEEAITAHRDLGGRALLPIHWATFDLALHPWAEPIERLLVAAAAAGQVPGTPRPGERWELNAAPPSASWWKPETAAVLGSR